MPANWKEFLPKDQDLIGNFEYSRAMHFSYDSSTLRHKVTIRSHKLLHYFRSELKKVKPYEVNSKALMDFESRVAHVFSLCGSEAAYSEAMQVMDQIEKDYDLYLYGPKKEVTKSIQIEEKPFQSLALQLHEMNRVGAIASASHTLKSTMETESPMIPVVLTLSEGHPINLIAYKAMMSNREILNSNLLTFNYLPNGYTLHVSGKTFDYEKQTHFLKCFLMYGPDYSERFVSFPPRELASRFSGSYDYISAPCDFTTFFRGIGWTVAKH